MINPFVIKGSIPDEYFCGRKESLVRLESLVTNGHNVVLMAERRMGKTALVEKFFGNERIRSNYNTISVDILETTSEEEFTMILSKAVFDRFSRSGHVLLKNLMAGLRSLTGLFGYDAVSQMPTVTLKLGSIRNPEQTLDELFAFLETTEKPNIIMIDEFQQISDYEGKVQMEAVLRSRIQKLRNTSFIFAGSEPTMLGRMFNDASRPFYKSSTQMELPSIPKEEYRAFAEKAFSQSGRHLSSDAFSLLYDFFEGVTYYIHYTLNVAFMLTDTGCPCGRKEIAEALRWILANEESSIKHALSQLSLLQKSLLYSIAEKGSVTGITSARFVRDTMLYSTSTVQSAARALMKKKLLSRIGEKYFVSDRFMQLWIIDIYYDGIDRVMDISL